MTMQKPVKIIIIAGQSNALGISPVRDLPKEKQRTYKTKIYFDTNTPHPFSKKWMRICPGFGHAKDLLFGLELPIAAVLEELQEEYVLIKYASDGTCLHEMWNPEKNGADWTALTQTIRQAVSDLIVQGRAFTFAGMVWQQGCSDAVDQEKSACYEHNLKRFFTAIRNLTDTKMPIAIGSVHPVHPAMIYAQQVIQAQQNTAADLENVRFVSTDGIEELVDDWHYDARCEWALGERLIASVLK
jgi:hypothetical protein